MMSIPTLTSNMHLICFLVLSTVYFTNNFVKNLHVCGCFFKFYQGVQHTVFGFVEVNFWRFYQIKFVCIHNAVRDTVDSEIFA